MTGFGKSSKNLKKMKISVELRSINSKYLEVNCRMPMVFSDKESEIKEVISQKISRGKISAQLVIEKNSTSEVTLQVKPEAVKEYLKLLTGIKKATGINLWTEWAKIEIAAHTGKKYKLPKVKDDYAGIVVSLSKFERPSVDAFNDPEVVWHLDKKHHIGLIVRSESQERVMELLDQYADRIKNEFHASLPAQDRPTN